MVTLQIKLIAILVAMSISLVTGVVDNIGIGRANYSSYLLWSRV